MIFGYTKQIFKANKGMIKFIDTGQYFPNRKSAKIALGHYNYNRLLKARRFEFINNEDMIEMLRNCTVTSKQQSKPIF